MIVRRFALGLVAALASGLAGPPAAGAEPANRPRTGAKRMADKPLSTVLVSHGGAGVLSPAEMAEERLTRADYEKALAQALAAGYGALQPEGKTSVDAVEAAIRV